MAARANVSRILVTIPAVFLAIVPPLVDFNESHLLNPLWPGHARLHTAWLLSTNSLISLLALFVLWHRPADTLQPSVQSSVRLAAALVGAILLGFFVAAAGQSTYAGSLTDPNGVTQRVGPFDANVFSFSVLVCLVLASLWLVRGREV
ncbi:MAG: hypothetical protein QNK05_04270 [Myxococcota bacterium]|nr:hypothetical protein [Myxococcota bacterium]